MFSQTKYAVVCFSLRPAWLWGVGGIDFWLLPPNVRRLVAFALKFVTENLPCYSNGNNVVLTW